MGEGGVGWEEEVKMESVDREGSRSWVGGGEGGVGWEEEVKMESVESPEEKVVRSMLLERRNTAAAMVCLKLLVCAALSY